MILPKGHEGRQGSGALENTSLTQVGFKRVYFGFGIVHMVFEMVYFVFEIVYFVFSMVNLRFEMVYSYLG